MRWAEWRNARRVAVKIGSALLTDGASGTLKQAWLEAIAEDVAALRREGRDVILVSSGPIALGRGALGLPRGALRLEEAQAAASVGQITLAHAYQAVFASRGLTGCQDTGHARRHRGAPPLHPNARNTIETLFKLGAIPVVGNENDTVATTEIRYGDNDRLAARVATMVTADCLVLLSDIDGLYTAPPAQNPERQAPGGRDRDHAQDRGDGGRRWLRAFARRHGDEARGGQNRRHGRLTHMVIASGKELHPLKALSKGAPCTWFLAAANPVTARKRWIAGTLEPKGVIVIDDGARAALQSGSSLLPAGVKSVSGQFGRGEAVIIRDESGGEVGRGLIGYNAEETAQIAGRNSMEIAGVLGYAGRAALIHRDDMALLRDLS